MFVSKPKKPSGRPKAPPAAIDPNTLWDADQVAKEFVKGKNRMENNTDPVEALASLRNVLEQFWSRYAVRVIQVWGSMNDDARKNLLRTSVPNMPETKDDVYVIVAGEHHNVKNAIELIPEMTLENLIPDRNLMDMFEKYATQPTDELRLENTQFIFDLFYDTPDFHCNTPRNERKLVMITPDMFGRSYDFIKEGFGPTSTPEMRRARELGAWLYNDEWQMFLERQLCIYQTLCALGDEFRSEVYGKGSVSLSLAGIGCLFCGATTPKLRKKFKFCGICGHAFYCSESCAKAHWVESHRAFHAHADKLKQEAKARRVLKAESPAGPTTDDTTELEHHENADPGDNSQTEKKKKKKQNKKNRQKNKTKQVFTSAADSKSAQIALEQLLDKKLVESINSTSPDPAAGIIYCPVVHVLEYRHLNLYNTLPPMPLLIFNFNKINAIIPREPKGITFTAEDWATVYDLSSKLCAALPPPTTNSQASFTAWISVIPLISNITTLFPLSDPADQARFRVNGFHYRWLKIPPGYGRGLGTLHTLARAELGSLPGEAGLNPNTTRVLHHLDTIIVVVVAVAGVSQALARAETRKVEAGIGLPLDTGRGEIEPQSWENVRRKFWFLPDLTSPDHEKVVEKPFESQTDPASTAFFVAFLEAAYRKRLDDLYQWSYGQRQGAYHNVEDPVEDYERFVKDTVEFLSEEAMRALVGSVGQDEGEETLKKLLVERVLASQGLDERLRFAWQDAEFTEVVRAGAINPYVLPSKAGERRWIGVIGLMARLWADKVWGRMGELDEKEKNEIETKVAEPTEEVDEVEVKVAEAAEKEVDEVEVKLAEADKEVSEIEVAEVAENMESLNVE